MSNIRVISVECIGYDLISAWISDGSNDYFKILNRDGKSVSDKKFLFVGPAYHDIIPVKRLNKKNIDGWSLLNRKTGEYIYDELYTDVPKVSEGVMRAHIKGKGYTFIDAGVAAGVYAGDKTRYYFEDTGDFNYGFASIKLKNKKWGYLGKTNNNGIFSFKISTKGEYKKASDFCEGMSCVEFDNGKWGYVGCRDLSVLGKPNGEPMLFKKTFRFKHGWGLVITDDGQYNYVNCRGKLLDEYGFDEAHLFYEYKVDKSFSIIQADVRRNGVPTIIDNRGAELFDVKNFLKPNN